jgi:hypothetical protein
MPAHASVHHETFCRYDEKSNQLTKKAFTTYHDLRSPGASGFHCLSQKYDLPRPGHFQSVFPKPVSGQEWGISRKKWYWLR